MAESVFRGEAARGVISINGLDVIEFNQNGNIYMIGAAGTIQTVNLNATTVTATNVNSTNFNTTSDIRLKDNVETIDNALGRVLGMRGVFYSLKSNPGKRQVGLIAQETYDVLQEAVNVGDDGYLGVEYGNIVGVLVEAIKDQHRQISDLQSQVNALMK